MPIIFGEMASSVGQIVEAFRRHGDRVRGTYRAHYRFDAGNSDPYGAPRLERPESLRGNPLEAVYPWESIFLAAATCSGSDYPMLAEHWGIALERVDFVVEGEFDPRREFEGLGDFRPGADSGHCYLSLHCRATLTSTASEEVLERLHERVIARNMVLDALRGIPLTSELIIVRVEADVAAEVSG